jgi:hypothetical protein
MPGDLSEDIVRRLLVTKYLLAANGDQLTPQSDPIAVARMVLVAHDAAELGAAAIASHVQVPDLPRPAYLMHYPSKITEKTGVAFAGGGYLEQLNTVRTSFKHHGILPDVRSWYRVVEKTWEYVDQWCQTYLEVPLEEIDLERLLVDTTVKGHYQDAKYDYHRGAYKAALESLGYGLLQVLIKLPGLQWPIVIPARGSRSAETALMLSAYGVRPSDFLALQQFLPVMSQVFLDHPQLQWNERHNGHRGNWTEPNVRFCLETFLDLALKVQHAPLVPRAMPYAAIFDDVITARGNGAELFQYQAGSSSLLAPRATGGRVVRSLQPGESLRCRVSSSNVDEESHGPRGTIEPNARPVLLLTIGEGRRMGPGGPLIPEVLYVDEAAVDVSSAPKDDPWVKQMWPHLFEGFDKEPPADSG